MSRYLRLEPWAFALLASGTACAPACDHHGQEEKTTLPKPIVKVEVVKKTSIAPTIPLAGVLAPLPGRDVRVGALVPGRVDRVFVAEGDPVKTGQILAHVEAGLLRDRVAEAEALAEQAKANLENARARLARTEKLYKDGIASKQELDDAVSQKVAAESGLKQAHAAGATAGLNLDRATLRAPFDGVVAAILVPAGQPVDGNGTPVIEVADTRSLDLRAPVSAARAPDLALGESAELMVEGRGTVTGTVAAIAPLVDPATNTVMIRIRIPNADGRLRGGMFARGVLLLPARNGVAIPKSALLPSEGGSATRVAVVTSSSTVSHRELVLGAEAGDRIEVQSGLEPEAKVIVAGGYSLPEGTAVEVSP